MGITSLGSGPPNVGSFPEATGPFGHLDQIGLAWEWCRDEWDPAAYSSKSASSSLQDPIWQSPEQDGRTTIRPSRGAGWWVDEARAYAAYRARALAMDRNSAYGFRVATRLGKSISAATR